MTNIYMEKETAGLFKEAKRVRDALITMGIKGCEDIRPFPFLDDGKVLFVAEKILTIAVGKNVINLYSTKEDCTHPVATVYLEGSGSEVYPILDLRCKISDYLSRKGLL